MLLTEDFERKSLTLWGYGVDRFLNEGISTADISAYIFVISNVENHEKIAFMKIKKKCRAGAKCRARWDQNHLIFFTWPYD